MPKKGEPLSAEGRAKVSAAQIKRFKELIPQRKEPDAKRCSCCGKVKPIAAFWTEKHKLASGLIAVRPRCHCKACGSAKAQERRDRKRAEGTLKEEQQRHNKRRDPERARAYAREWSMARRREEGKPARGGWRKYRNKTSRAYAYLPAKPISDFLNERVAKGSGLSEIARASGVPERSLRRLYDREGPRARLETVDAILSGLGCPEEMHLLYPDTSVGYHLLTPDGEKVMPGDLAD